MPEPMAEEASAAEALEANQLPTMSGPESGEITENPLDKEEEVEQLSYSWPVMNFQIPPYRTYHFFQQFRTNPSIPNNFLKAVKWSPDGYYFLTCSDDNTFRVFPLQYDENGGNVDSCSSTSDSDSYAANCVIGEGESVYDYCWYPYMSVSSPDTCVFASTTRDHPIHLWDSISGQLRCTYRAYDAMDEITAAFSVAFNPTGTKLFAGYNKSLRIFDVHRPGRDFKEHSTLQGKKEGQSALFPASNFGLSYHVNVTHYDIVSSFHSPFSKSLDDVQLKCFALQAEYAITSDPLCVFGIISSIAFCPSKSGMLATGSYDQTTAICREDNMELLYVLHGQEGGVTHVQFSKDGNYLYTGGRKDPYVLCWDIRKTVEIVYKLYRSTETTNQRIHFDIEPTGQHLATGGQDGLVHIYNLQNGQWVSSFQAALDTVNGFSFHPFSPMAASSSGHRRYGGLDDSYEDANLSGDENCVSIWSFSFTNGNDVSSANFEELNGQIESNNLDDS